MLTPHETAVEHLKLLNRSDHPEIEELLAVVRQHPVEIQRACEEAMKRGEDAAILYPIRSIADRHAVALQELLEALTATMPHRVDLMRAAELSLADRQAGEQSPFLPGTEDDLLWRQQHGRSLDDLRAFPTDGPDPLLGREHGFVSGRASAATNPAFGALPTSAPFTQSGLTPNPESGRSGLDTSQAAAPFVDPGTLPPGAPSLGTTNPSEWARADDEVIRSEPFAVSDPARQAFAQGVKDAWEAASPDELAAQIEANDAERAVQNANMGGHPADEPLATSKL